MFKKAIKSFKDAIERDKRHKERLYERFINGDYITIFNDDDLGNMYYYEKDTLCYLNDKNIFLKDETDKCTWTRYRINRKNKYITYNPFHNGDDTDFNQSYYPTKKVIDELRAKDEDKLTDLEKHIIIAAEASNKWLYIGLVIGIIVMLMIQI